MKTNELIYAIREKLKAYTDDTRYTDDWLLYLIRLKRAVFLRREYNQLQRTIDPEVLQTICMPLTNVDESECPDCYSISSPECFITRTVDKLPASIELHNRNTVVKIAPVGRFDKPFSIVNKSNFVYAGESRYERNIVFATVDTGGYIYLKSKNPFYKTLEAITVTLLFDNPEDANAFECNGVACYDNSNDEYPIKGWMADIVITEIVNELANLKQIPTDTTNNAKDENSSIK
jgi:hypothetical protein